MSSPTQNAVQMTMPVASGTYPSAADEPRKWVPSQFNARTTAPDGTLVLWNSYSHAFSGFPPEARPQVEPLLHRRGFTAPPTGLTKYMADRGFIVPRGAREFERFQLRYGQRHYRQDFLDLTLLSSEDCNFRCIYCYETFERGTMEPWVRTALIRMMEQRAPHLRRLTVSYFGGEPLLGFEAIAEVAPAFLKLAGEHGIRFSSGMTTNAYLLTPDTFAKLLQWNIKQFQVTIDGLPEDHDCRRMLKGGGPTFSRILENLKAIQTFPNEFGVMLRVNFDQANARRMREFIALLGCFKEDARFKLFFYPIRQLGGSNDGSLKTCGDMDPQRDVLEVLGREMGMQVHRTVPNSRPFGEPCYANEPQHLTVGANGNLMKCTVMLDSNPRNIVGRLKEDGTMAIDIDRFARWCTPHFRDDSVCRKCFFLPLCGGAVCPVRRVVNNQRCCPPEKLRIGNVLKKMWLMNNERANRYDMQREKLLRYTELSPPGTQAHA